MSAYVYAPKQDANHAEIVAAYRELYCTVQDTHKVGFGFPDIVVKVPTKWGPVVALVEIKTAEGTLSPKQIRFITEWGSCVAIVQTRGEAIAHVERVRKGE